MAHENEESTDSAGGMAGEVFVISVAAQLAGMHAQTLRTYDRMGLVTPQRTRGGGRRYSKEDVDLLRQIQNLSQEHGVNLAGIKEIIELKQQNRELKKRLAKLESDNDELRAELERSRAERNAPRSVRPRGELVHVPRSTAVVMWEPRRGRRRP